MASSAGKPYTPLPAAIESVNKGSGRKFVERFTPPPRARARPPRPRCCPHTHVTPVRERSVDAAVRLNIDPRKADQALRGLAVLPHGVGKKMRIIVFATGPAAEAAKKVRARHFVLTAATVCRRASLPRWGLHSARLRSLTFVRAVARV